MPLYKMKHVLIFIVAIGMYSSCSPTMPDTVIHPEDLEGTWTLDSTLSQKGHYYGTMNGLELKTFVFKNGTDYTYLFRNGDVGNEFYGKYFILYNPKRGLSTLSFIPDLSISDKDTFRGEFMNFDIEKIKDDKLYLIKDAEFIDREGLPTVIFYEKSIYRKVK